MMKNSWTTRRCLVVLCLVLCVAILLYAVTFNDNASYNSAYAADATANDSLTLTLTNDGTGYKVIARNKQITSARIPEKYNGLPVTEIADNGFTNCANLKEVWIPHTVKRIGNNAFANCRNLERISGMPRVEYVGNNAFAMCAKLDNLILPDSINSLGSTILRNNPNTVYSRMSEAKMMALNANWKASSTVEVIYGNELVLTEVADDNENIIGYSITMQQNLNTDVDFVLGDTYNGLPLLEIEQYAFYFSQFNSFTLKHGIIDPDVNSNKGFTPSETDCDHSVNIASGAFYGMITNYIDILVDITFDDPYVDDPTYFDYENGHSIEVFCNSTARSITIPNNIAYLPKSMFSDCFSLREIKNTDAFVDVNRISTNITTIGTDAFANCQAMINLYIPNTVTKMGNSVFNNWGGSDVVQTIHFSDIYEAPVGKDGYEWNANWKGETFDNLNIQFKTISVVFDKDGGVDNIGTNDVLAMYNQDMPEADAPQRDHYDFGGYFSQHNGKGTQYYDENMSSVRNWDKKEATVLYAYWIPHTFTVVFDKDGGTGGSDEVIASYEQPMPMAIKPAKTGHDFQGYFYSNIQYYDKNMNSTNNWNFTEDDIVLIAKWKNREYQVILNEWENITHNITVTFDNPMPPVDKPVKAGSEFKGYYTQENGQGVQYYNENMSSVRNWDIDEDMINLYAYWVQKSYTITFHREGGTGGTEQIPNIHYGDKFPDAEVSTKPYNIFKGYYSVTGDLFYTDEMIPTRSTYDIDGNLDLYAKWNLIEYNIEYDLGGGTNNPQNPTSFNINDHVVLANPTNNSLIFTGWTYNGTAITDLDGIIENLDKDITSITVKANWTDTQTYNTTVFDELHVSAPKVVINFTEGFTSNCQLYIASTTKSIDINGQENLYNMNIIIDSESKGLGLVLRNIRIRSHSDQPAISASYSTGLELYTYGSVSIYGSTKSNGDGTAAITCGNLDIVSSTKIITIAGGNGKDGEDGISGTNGGNAGPGVIVGEKVVIACNGVHIKAGSAGNGGNAENPAIGYKGYGGYGTTAVVGINQTPKIYKMDGLKNVDLANSSNGVDGKGREDVKPPRPEYMIAPSKFITFPGSGIVIPTPPVGPVIK